VKTLAERMFSVSNDELAQLMLKEFGVFREELNGFRKELSGLRNDFSDFRNEFSEFKVSTNQCFDKLDADMADIKMQQNSDSIAIDNIYKVVNNFRDEYSSHGHSVNKSKPTAV